MRLPGCECPLIGFQTARREALRLAGYIGRPILVTRLSGTGIARRSGRAIRFSEAVPACAPAHEIAHLWANDNSHGGEWLKRYLWLSPCFTVPPPPEPARGSGSVACPAPAGRRPPATSPSG